jgi:endonuclease YncB( thermonuclease family)
VPVRLAGIDAPELDQTFGSLAQKHAENLSRGQLVTVQVLDTDPRGRTVGVVVLPDGRDLGREMVAVGLARWDQRNAPEAAVLEDLEKEARAAGRGMWRDPALASPR